MLLGLWGLPIQKSPPKELIKTMYENIYSHITAAAPTTTTCSDRPCILESITVNKALATGVITVYDGTASQNVIIAIITSPATLLQNHFYLPYGVVCKTGLTVVTSIAAQDITVAYRPTMM